MIASKILISSFSPSRYHPRQVLAPDSIVFRRFSGGKASDGGVDRKRSDAPKIRAEGENARQTHDPNEEDVNNTIHPDWLALERRLQSRRPRTERKNGEEASRSSVRPTAWDGENV